MGRRVGERLEATSDEDSASLVLDALRYMEQNYQTQITRQKLAKRAASLAWKMIFINFKYDRSVGDNKPAANGAYAPGYSGTCPESLRFYEFADIVY